MTLNVYICIYQQNPIDVIMKKYLKITLFICLGLFITFTSFSQKSKGDAFVFSYFKGNGETGLHLAYSDDGLTWKALNDGQPILAPKVGESKLMRDPCIVLGPDKKYHMVWTAGWTEKGIGYANSTDLINWSEQKYIPVMAHEATARNTWAPEITYDNKNKFYMIYWATTIPGRFTETASTGDDGYNHRMYYVTTKDFETFIDAKLLYDPGFNSIDATIVKEGKEYIMFIKDETRNPPAKNILVARSNNLTGPYGNLTGPITDNWVEGPTAVKINGNWIVYYDKYTRGSMGAVMSSDLKNWEEISDRLEFPQGTRHGTVLRVNKKDLEGLKKLNIHIR
jgi:beta-xylosidase